MIGERLDVLPDVLYLHRLAVNGVFVKDCMTSPVVFFLFFAINTILVDQASSGQLMVS